MSGQLDLEFAAAYRAGEEWPRVLDEVRHVADRYGRKQAAHELDWNRSRLDNVLADRDRHSLRAEDLLFFLALDDRDSIIRELASFCGYELTPKVSLTPEQKLARIERAIERFNPGLADELKREAYG